MTKRIFVVLLLVLKLSSAKAQFQKKEQEDKVQLDEIAKACVSAQKKDEICATLVQIQQIGKDAVEAIKTFVDLGPSEYAVLTIANFAVTQRLRIRTHPLLFKNVENTLDYKDGTLTLILEKNL